MAHDLVIRGGTLVDGTGAEPWVGDVAVDDGVITAVGGKAGRGQREIDAGGLTVSPGFVDIHTHLDAQIGWDPLATPVSWHGVTTALMGNCGVTFAPCRPTDRELLAGMMETVENIPRQAILSGLSWDWEGYGGYLDAIERLRPAVNIAGMVGHSAVRYYVMGERAVAEPANDAEKRQIAELVGRSIDEGAVGFSSNRFPGHVLPDGRSIPGTFAEHDEMLQIAQAIRPRNALMQNVMEFRNPQLDNAVLLRKLAETTGGRILVSYNAGASDNSGHRGREFMDRITAGGCDVTALSLPRGSGFVFGLQASLPCGSIWSQTGHFGPTWEALAALDFAGRVAAIASDDFCARLVQEASFDADGKPRDAARLPYIASGFWMGAAASPNYTDPADQNLLALAAAAGEHWSQTFLRLTRASGGHGLFTYRAFCSNTKSLGDLLGHPRVMPGLSDAGAHVSQVSDGGVSTFILNYWVKQVGLYSLAEGVRRLTGEPARVVGLKDRGVLRPGYRADINVFDFDRIGEEFPRLVHDFPFGAPRFVQRSRGYVATIVNGQVAVENGEHTQVRAGEVLRHVP